MTTSNDAPAIPSSMFPVGAHDLLVLWIRRRIENTLKINSSIRSSTLQPLIYYHPLRGVDRYYKQA